MKDGVFIALDKPTHPNILLLLPPGVKLRSQRLAKVLLWVAQLLDLLVQALHMRFGQTLTLTTTTRQQQPYIAFIHSHQPCTHCIYIRPRLRNTSELYFISHLDPLFTALLVDGDQWLVVVLLLLPSPSIPWISKSSFLQHSW